MNHIKWNEILKGAERNLFELLQVESEKVIAKIQIEVDNSINTDYPDNVEAEAKRLLDRNKYLENTLELLKEMENVKQLCGLWII